MRKSILILVVPVALLIGLGLLWLLDGSEVSRVAEGRPSAGMRAVELPATGRSAVLTGRSLIEAKFRLSPGAASFHGRVVDQQGRGVPKLEVIVVQCESGFVDAIDPEEALVVLRVRTDRDGAFAYATELADAPAWICVDLSSGYCLIEGAWAFVPRALPGSTQPVGDICVERALLAAGRIVDEAGQPIRGASVSVFARSLRWLEVPAEDSVIDQRSGRTLGYRGPPSAGSVVDFSDEKGVFALHVSRHSKSLRIAIPGCMPIKWPLPESIDGKLMIGDVTLPLKPSCVVRVLGSEGKPVSRVELAAGELFLRIQGSDSIAISEPLLVDRGGPGRVFGLNADANFVAVRAEGTSAWTVVPWENQEELSITLATPEPISIHVCDLKGDPVRGAMVTVLPYLARVRPHPLEWSQLQSGGYGTSTVTDENGRAQLELNCADSWVFTSHPSHGITLARMDLGANDPERIVLGGPKHAKVMGEQGALLAGAQVLMWIETGYPTDSFRVASVADSRGLAPVLSSDLEIPLSAKLRGYVERFRSSQNSIKRQGECTLVLAPECVIQGHVQLFGQALQVRDLRLSLDSIDSAWGVRRMSLAMAEFDPRTHRYIHQFYSPGRWRIGDVTVGNRSLAPEVVGGADEFLIESGQAIERDLLITNPHVTRRLVGMVRMKGREGADMTVVCRHGHSEWRAWVQPSGAYELEGMFPEQIEVVLLGQAGGVWRAPLTLRQATTVLDIEIETGHLRGFACGESERLLAAGSVTALGVGQSFDDDNLLLAFVDENGRFDFGRVAVGDYLLKFDPEGSDIEPSMMSLTKVTVREGSQATGIRVRAPLQLKGNVTVQGIADVAGLDLELVWVYSNHVIEAVEVDRIQGYEVSLIPEVYDVHLRIEGVDLAPPVPMAVQAGIKLQGLSFTRYSREQLGARARAAGYATLESQLEVNDRCLRQLGLKR